MAPTHQFRRGRAYQADAPGEKAVLVSPEKTRSYPAFADALAPQLGGKGQMESYVQRAAASPGYASLFGCPAWAGRPISKWCQYGYWSPDGEELTVTGIDLKRRAVWPK